MPEFVFWIHYQFKWSFAMWKQFTTYNQKIKLSHTSFLPVLTLNVTDCLLPLAFGDGGKTEQSDEERVQ